MDLSKLKSIRSGNRSAVTKLIRKIDAAKQDTDFDPEELNATFENLLQKQKILNNLNEQILNLAEDIESEILDSDDQQHMNFHGNNGQANQTSVHLVNDTNQKEEDTSILYSSSVEVRINVLLKTSVAPVWSDHSCRDTHILLDEGAQRSFVTEDLARKLNLHSEGTEILQLSSFGDRNKNVRHLDKSTVFVETDAGQKIPIHVLIVPMIDVPLQNNIRHINRGLNYLRGLKLAHPVTQEESFEISLLIGADYYWDLVEDEVIRGNGPTAVRSKLGFLLSGPVRDKRDNSLMGTSIFNILVSHKTEEHDIETFWRLESIGINSKETDDDDTDFLETYQDTSIELRGNKYFAKLPWKHEHDELPSNYTVTRRRTENVIKKLSQDPKLLKKYGDIIAEQERRGFVETVDEKEQKGGKIHYIPHHPIHKESSTTPIRIVYDCSCRQSPSHPSLNDCLMDTPPKLNDLTKLLVQFRANQFATCTDIEKAFLHVGLSKEDRDVTRFLWLSDPTNPGSQMKTYRFKAVLFGATSSPFILNVTIQKHLKQFGNSETAKVLERDIYVDNILSSMNKEEDLLTYFKEARSLMAGAGFNLRSWSSNSAKLLELAKEENVLDTDKYTKILGMLWNSRSDEIFYPKRDIPTPELLQHVTKREVLKYSSKIYDPLGLLSPVKIRGKILIQELWKCGLDWDELIPDNLKTTWIDLTKDLEKAIQFTIPRYYFSKPSASTELVLHVFTDASPKAYGAAAYLSSGNESTLVIAKTRVAPVKCLTLPQLELMAAIIGARLAAHLHSTLNYPKIVFWSDSSIVLHWLTSTKTLKRFIANRVKEITELTHPYKWRYCPTDNNPADLLTRGLTIEQFDQRAEELKRLCESATLKETLSIRGIEWKFIPKRAPWYGGFWERLIALTKTSLKKTLGRTQVSMETLQTVVTEIERILNDRPLTYFSSDIRDCETLTPAHLLYGRRISGLPYPQIDIEEFNDPTYMNHKELNKCAHRQTLLIQHFWTRWKSEYLIS
ncbi:uncharacterized protein LOC143043745 [Mytilus galloprovincialis]|uniref:uncharacterized protein LOC143043745 n=1 Tax=Mytilus galloprovincialis TaxID=29158 RepID=UPI003F7B800F